VANTMSVKDQGELSGLPTSHRGRVTERVARSIFLLCAVLIVVIIVSIFIFVGVNAFHMFGDDPNSRNFLSTTNWDPQANRGTTSYGMLGFILGSVVITLLSVVIASPLSFGMALFMTEVCPKWLENILRPLIEVFTGMPSVVIGFLATIILIPLLRITVGPYTSIPAIAGYGWAAATIVLVVMIVPTITSISIDTLRAVPGSIREASLALGSTRWQMMKDAILPAATTGLATAVVLGMGRAIGEALAVALVLKGNGALPQNLLTPLVFFGPNINMTSPIVLNFSEAFGAERDAYLMLGFLLLIICFLFVCISRYLASRSVYK
jgi:phosphate transport system permease protein